jgi:tetratricopeptide (TPR) repeat protein
MFISYKVRLKIKEFQSLCVILAERLLSSFWRPLSWIAAFSGIWLLDLPFLAGDKFEILLELLFFAGLFWFIWTAFRKFRLPRMQDARRRLEDENFLSHRPLSSSNDRLANPFLIFTRRLWVLGRRDLPDIAKKLKRPSINTGLSEEDPYALRYIAFLLFITGIVAAGPDWHSRLSGHFTYNFPSFHEDKNSRVTLRIIPPEYTGLAEAVFQDFSSENKFAIPEGSRLKVTVNGGPVAPRLSMGGESFSFNKSGADSYMLDMPVLPGEEIKISRFLWPVARFQYSYDKDNPPEISLAGEVEKLDSGRLRVHLEIKDDYGVKTLKTNLDLDENTADSAPPFGGPVTGERLIMSPAGETATIHPVYDFASHSWAGLPVIFKFAAVDAKGQKAEMEPLHLVLPERKFDHPVSSILAELRKQLIWKPEYDSAEVAHAIEQIVGVPASFDHDIVVLMALRAAASRLRYSPGEESIKTLIPLLWDIAVRIDGGELNVALRDLEQAQENLEKALADPETGDGEIARLMLELRQSLARYMQELGKELVRNENTLTAANEQLASSIDSQTLSAILDHLQSLALSGKRHDAQELLSKIRRMTDMLGATQFAEMPPEIKHMDQSIGKLQNLVQKQQELLDQTVSQMEKLDSSGKQTYGEWLENENGEMSEMPPPPVDKSAVARHIDTSGRHAEQEVLRYALGQLMREAAEVLDEVPESMGMAELEMRKSSMQLLRNRPGGSIPYQEKAIEHLRQASERLRHKLAKRMKQYMGMGISVSRTDPLGRAGEEGGTRNFFGTEVRIPDKSERKKIDEILEILRDRSGELYRPEEELDYYRRLLRQF